MAPSGASWIMKALWPSAAFALLILVTTLPPAAAQEGEAVPPARLLLQPAAPLPRGGLYIANDLIEFMLDNRAQVRLRFVDSDEVFYLSSEPAPLGGRILKYDTGDVALQVAGWGAVTLYTEDARWGIPAERIGDGLALDPNPIPAADVRQFAANLAQEISKKEDLAIGFVADWTDLARTDARSAERRALAADSMRSAAQAVVKLARAGMRSVLEKSLHIVRVIQGTKPAATMQRGVLTVSYAPQSGPSARPSSLVIVRVVRASL